MRFEITDLDRVRDELLSVHTLHENISFSLDPGFLCFRVGKLFSQAVDLLVDDAHFLQDDLKLCILGLSGGVSLGG